MQGFDWATLLAGILTAGATLAGFYFASVQIRLATEQHRSAERWRRTEFAARLMERLTTDDELAFCSRALDWGVGPLIIPIKHRMLFKGKQAKFEHDWNDRVRLLSR